MRLTFHDSKDCTNGLDDFNSLPPIPENVDDFQSWLQDRATGQYAEKRKERKLAAPVEDGKQRCVICGGIIVGRRPNAKCCSNRRCQNKRALLTKRAREAKKKAGKV